MQPDENNYISGITHLSVKGFKSIRDQLDLEIHPLTILAGANSTGKSSAIQPLLLLKQTLESSSDPGRYKLSLRGSHANFTMAEQLIWGGEPVGADQTFSVALIGMATRKGLFEFVARSGEGCLINRVRYVDEKDSEVEVRPGMTEEEIRRILPPELRHLPSNGADAIEGSWEIEWNACFPAGFRDRNTNLYYYIMGSLLYLKNRIAHIIHVPALRGSNERTYDRSGVGPVFPRPFTTYAASIVYDWQTQEDPRFVALCRWLKHLGLTSQIMALPVKDVELELRVARLPGDGQSAANAFVNIADVGFGVSQVLPVLVALLVAEPGQLVYIEEPEIHLHPQAQVALASLLADAAKRGVRLVIETHSALLLLGVQTLVAKGELKSALVKLHWFERDAEGATQVHSGDLDEKGRFGDWPQDFGRVEMAAENEYLDASLFQGRKP